MRIIEVAFEKGYPPKLIGESQGWTNEQPLKIKRFARLPRKRFPLIEDFEIALEKNETISEGYQIFFFSEQRGGYIAGFVWWDYIEKDLCKEDFKIPLSYYDIEQGWQLSIGKHGDFVYICESDFDHPENGIHSWFKVAKERYITEWKLAIAAAKLICSDKHYIWKREVREIKNLRPEGTDEIHRELVINYSDELDKQIEMLSVFAEPQAGVRYRCPCCQYKTLLQRGGYEICPVCCWVDDGQDDADANTIRLFSPNTMVSLTQGRQNYIRFGASDERVLKYVRQPLPEEQ
jgi:hypothetical protein